MEETAVNHYLSGATKVDAYSMAGFWKGQTQKTARNQASLFFQSAKIAHEVARRRAKAAEKALIDRAYVVTGFRRLYEHAAEFIDILDGKGGVIDSRPRNWAEARKNLEILGRDVGVGVAVHKHEIGAPGDFARLTADETRAELAARFRTAGVDERSIAALLASPPGGTA
jgi:hypothetical protein